MATHFTFNAVLRQDGEVLLDAHGKPRMRAFVVPAALVEIEPTWRSMGLRATASHAYRVARPVGGAPNTPSTSIRRAPPRRARCTAFPSSPSPTSRWRPTWPAWRHHFVELAADCIAHRRNRFADDGEPPDRGARRSPPCSTSARARLGDARARVYAALDAAWASRGGEGRVSEAQADAAGGAVDRLGGRRRAPRSTRCIPTAACSRRARTARSTASGATFIRRPSMRC